MAVKPLKRMSRRELLEMLVAQGKEAAQLQEELDKARAELSDRRIRIEKAGSLAEAALAVNGVFEAAEAAAKQYLENIRADHEEKQPEPLEAPVAEITPAEEETLSVKAERAAADVREEAESPELPSRQTAEAVVCDANKKAERILSDAKAEAEAVVSGAKAEAETVLSEAKAEADAILTGAKTEAEKLLAEAEAEKNRRLKQADIYVRNVGKKLRAFYEQHPELREALK